MSKEPWGLLGIEPKTGRQRWKRSLFAKPRQMDCHIVDVSGDTVDDCVVVGEKGLMAVVDPIRGELDCF